MSPASGAPPFAMPYPESTPRARMRAASARRARTLSAWATVLFLATGLSLESPLLLSLGTAALGSLLALTDIARGRESSITPITIYAVSCVVASLANAVGFALAEGPWRSRFFLYAVEEHLFLAASLWLAGTAIPVLAFWVISRPSEDRRLMPWLPRVTGRLEKRTVAIWGSIGSLAAMGLQVLDMVPSLGTVTAIITLVPQLAVFVMARLAADRRDNVLLGVALVITLLEAFRAILFEYLRIQLVAPFVAFGLGLLLGRRSLSALRSLWFVPVYAVMIVFPLVFGLLGQIRAAGGGSRLAQLEAVQQADERGSTMLARPQSFVARLTTYNQLSQIGRLVERDGYYDGSTLEYLGFAFIPRFLWPEKPLIAKGSWFALQIGQAYVHPDGRVSNAINMTVPGELYLNFGWLGVMLGCSIYGILLAILWSRADFWSGADNVLGGAFGFYLLWIGLISAPDLQVVVTMLAIYLIFVAAAIALGGGGLRRAAPAGTFARPT